MESDLFHAPSTEVKRYECQLLESGVSVPPFFHIQDPKSTQIEGNRKTNESDWVNGSAQLEPHLIAGGCEAVKNKCTSSSSKRAARVLNGTQDTEALKNCDSEIQLDLSGGKVPRDFFLPRFPCSPFPERYHPKKNYVYHYSGLDYPGLTVPLYSNPLEGTDLLARAKYLKMLTAKYFLLSFRL